LIDSSDEAKAADRHMVRDFEMFGNRASDHDGWTAATKHRTPWASHAGGPLLADDRDLYHLAEGFSQARNVAAEHADQLDEFPSPRALARLVSEPPQAQEPDGQLTPPVQRKFTQRLPQRRHQLEPVPRQAGGNPHPL